MPKKIQKTEVHDEHVMDDEVHAQGLEEPPKPKEKTKVTRKKR